MTNLKMQSKCCRSGESQSTTQNRRFFEAAYVEVSELSDVDEISGGVMVPLPPPDEAGIDVAAVAESSTS